MGQGLHCKVPLPTQRGSKYCRWQFPELSVGQVAKSREGAGKKAREGTFAEEVW